MTIVFPLRRARSYAHGKHEPHVMDALAAIVSEGMVALDVGSHLGYFTLALARLVGRSGQVFAFEPMPRHVALLARTLARNCLPQVAIVPCAVGARSGTATLEEWPNEAMTRVLENAPAPWGLRRFQVPVLALDDWAAQVSHLGRLDAVKVDVEGHELAVLQGAAGLLHRYRPRIVCELHRRRDVAYAPRDLVAWLERAGYRVKLIPSPVHPGRTLHEALAVLETAELPPGWVAVAHVLATPLPS